MNGVAPPLELSQRIRHQARVGMGSLLHKLGAYRQLMPIFAQQPTRLRKRLLGYLQHYLDSVPSAEAELMLEPLGARFACDLNDHMLVHYLRNETPIYELAEINFFRSQARPGDHILDIGANHGFWGVSVASAAGTGAKLDLFEANPLIAGRLRRTLALNPSVSARLHACAIADGSAQSLQFYRPQGNLSGLGSTVLHDYATGHGYLRPDDVITVPARSLDQLLAAGEITGMDLLKIDVEQAEDAVIRGARVALEHFRPRMLMVETGIDSAATRDLQALGYRVARLGKGGLEDAIPAGFWGNLIFSNT